MKYYIRILMLFLFIFNINLITAAQEENCPNEIEIPDENFRNELSSLGFTFNNQMLCVNDAVVSRTALYLNGLDISDLTGISAFTGLTTLKCQDNNLTSLNLDNNINLVSLWCSGNELTELDLTLNTKLKGLFCYSNNLTNLTLPDAPLNGGLTNLNCSINALEILIVSQHTALINLNVEFNYLETLNLSANTSLKHIYCNSNNLESIDLKNGNNDTSYFEFMTVDASPVDDDYNDNENLCYILVDDVTYSNDNWGYSIDDSITSFFLTQEDADAHCNKIICNEPDNENSTVTATTVYITWENTNSSVPENGWEVTYTLGTYNNTEDPSISLIGNPIITYQPEVYIEDLIPANDYTFFIRALCSEQSSSDTVAVQIVTNCSNCTSFKPKSGKEYVISAWVKEDWSNRPDVSINVEKNSIKTMLHDLVLRYKDFHNGLRNEVCPNGTVVDGLIQINEDIQATTNDIRNPFHQDLLDAIISPNIDGRLQPAIYNFRYEDDGVSGAKFKFQFTDPGEMVWSDNLVVNPGAELPIDPNVWVSSSSTYPMERDIAERQRYPHNGEYFFLRHDIAADWSAWQDISVKNYIIDNGDCSYEFQAFLWRWDFADIDENPHIKLQFLNQDNIISEIVYNPTFNEEFEWARINGNGSIPTGTTKIRINLVGDYIEGDDNNSLFDDISLTIGSYPDSNKIQTFDVDCFQDDGTYDFIDTFTLTDPKHYPYSNFYYNLNYTCNTHTINSKYRYGANVFKFINDNIAVNKQVYTYSHTFIQLTYLNDVNEVIASDFNRTFEPSGNIIDGWQRIQGVFKVPHDTAKVKIELVNGLDGPDNDGDEVDPDIPDDYQSDAYFDDVRIFPKDGNMKSFVYDQKTQKLMAELDENNYATFYEYDTEGGLIRVKKETEKGVFTIQETRSGNIKQ